MRFTNAIKCRCTLIAILYSSGLNASMTGCADIRFMPFQLDALVLNLGYGLYARLRCRSTPDSACQIITELLLPGLGGLESS